MNPPINWGAEKLGMPALRAKAAPAGGGGYFRARIKHCHAAVGKLTGQGWSAMLCHRECRWSRGNEGNSRSWKIALQDALPCGPASPWFFRRDALRVSLTRQPIWQANHVLGKNSGRAEARSLRRGLLRTREGSAGEPPLMSSQSAATWPACSAHSSPRNYSLVRDRGTTAQHGRLHDDAEDGQANEENGRAGGGQDEGAHDQMRAD